MTDNYKPWTRNETNQNSFGGTELHMEKLIANLDPELLQHFQLIPSRVRDLRDDTGELRPSQSLRRITRLRIQQDASPSQNHTHLTLARGNVLGGELNTK